MIEFYAIRFLIEVCRFIPYKVQLSCFSILLRIFLACSSRYRSIVKKNLEIAFPELSEVERARILKASTSALARTIADTLRISRLTPEWFRQNVSFPQKEEFQKRVEEVAPRGVLCVGGHLGSFEILPSAAAAHTGYTGKVVAREFKNKRLNEWWNQNRSAHGVEIINRSGALRKMLRVLRSDGGYVGILYDQNVTRNLATFVNWFGIPAATTVAVGYCAVKNEIPVFAVTIEPRPGGSYEILIKEVELDAIRADDSLSFDEKVQAITQKVTDVFTEFIRNQAEGWFWMHRRWKTRPLESDPGIYPDAK